MFFSLTNGIIEFHISSKLARALQNLSARFPLPSLAFTVSLWQLTEVNRIMRVIITAIASRMSTFFFFFTCDFSGVTNLQHALLQKKKQENYVKEYQLFIDRHNEMQSPRRCQRDEKIGIIIFSKMVILLLLLFVQSFFDENGCKRENMPSILNHANDVVRQNHESPPMNNKEPITESKDSEQIKPIFLLVG